MSTRRIQRRHARQTLGKRIKKAMRISNFISIGIIIVLVMMLLFGILKMITTAYVQYSTSQMALVISDQWQYKEDDNTDYITEMVDYLASSNYMNSSISGPKEFKNPSDLDKTDFLTSLSENLIYYKVSIIEKDSVKVIYNSEDTDEYKIEQEELRHLLDLLVTTSSANIYDFPQYAKDTTTEEDSSMVHSMVMNTMDKDKMASHKVGMIEATLNPNLAIGIILSILVFGLLILFVNSIVTGLLRYILSGLITKPVRSVAAQLKALAEGDIETSMQSKVVVRNPVTEVMTMTDATNKIIAKTYEYVSNIENQSFELEAQRDELESQNATLEERSIALSAINDAYLGRTLNLQNLLDNVGQGFLTFGRDLKVNPEYSLECESILCANEKNKIKGIKITELFDDSIDKEFLEELLMKVFDGEPGQKELYKTLLPEEIEMNGQQLKIEYKTVHGVKGEQQMMVIITDITQRRALEIQMEQERNLLQMIVKVLMNRNEFIDLIDDFKRFSEVDFGIAHDTDYEETLREIHTFKGTFSQYYMTETVDYLNNLEDELQSDTQRMKVLNQQQVLATFLLDLDKIKAYVGDDFFGSADIYSVKEEKINEIEFRLKDLLPDYEYNKVLPLIRSIRHKTVKQLLRSYPDYTVKLGERLEKSVELFEITGDEIYVDNSVYHKVFKTLIHMFRNAVDHGIEEEEERLMFKKPSSGCVKCDVENNIDSFTITIADDGKGIDKEHIVQSAMEKGIISSEPETDKEIYDLLFMDGITTKDEATVISGRGVGLAAVKYAVEELGGTITTTSELGFGTVFKIVLPYVTDSSLVTFTADKLMLNISQVMEKYIKSLHFSLGEFVQSKTNRISLLRVNALISIKGAIEGILFLSTNEPLGRVLTKSFIFEEIEDEYITDYIEDVLGEITNTVMGNVLGTLEEQGVYMTIGVPALISNKEAYMKYTESEIIVFHYTVGEYELSLNLLLIDSNEEKTIFIGR